MDLTAAIAVVVAALLPFAAAVFTRPGMSDGRKRLIVGAVALVLGVIVAIATGQLEGVPPGLVTSLGRAVVSVAIIVSLGQGFYRAFKGSVQQLEAATSPQAPPEEDSPELG